MSEYNMSEIAVLVVEDHAFQRRYLRSLLEKLDVKNILEAEDGHAALKVLEDGGSDRDVIFCDLQMPGMDGVELIRKLGEMGCTARLVLVSGMEETIIASVRSMAAAYGLSVLGYLNKPPPEKDVSALLERHLKRPVRTEDAPPVALPEISQGDVRKALKSDSFVPHYQPLIDLDSHQVVSIETLARWKRADGTFIPPGAFIPIAEKSGMITEITLKIAEQAFYDLKVLSEDYPKLRMSLNLSFASLGDTELPDLLIKLAEENNIKTDRIVLETTESWLYVDFAKTLDVLNRLRLRGFELSLDDFGTGYSTLSQLCQIPFNEIKIDRSLVTKAHKSNERRMILESCLDLAKRLQLRTVAEGIESIEDWRTVSNLGADIGQGFYMAKPGPREALVASMANWREISQKILAEQESLVSLTGIEQKK